MTQQGTIHLATDDDDDSYPFGQDSIDYWNVVEKFVYEYVDVYYLDDASVLADRELVEFWDGLRVTRDSKIPQLSGKKVLVRVLTHFIFGVTGVHNHVGTIADYLVDPRFTSAKIRPGREVADIQATFQGFNIALMTASKMPKLLNNFTHLLLDDEHLKTTTAIFNGFQDDLKRLSELIDERNKRRTMPCNAMNPKTMLCSVSI